MTTAGEMQSPTWADLGLVAARPALQMALDEVLLGEVAAGNRSRLVRFWDWTSRCLVLGSNQSVANEVDAQEASRLGFQVVRRMSGGGTMICEAGRTLSWSLCLPERLVAGMTFRESYAYLDAWVVAALRRLGVEAGYRPINEVVSPSGKIGGAAQARRRGAVLHHVTMAYSIDPLLVPRLIRIGRERLVPRGLRSAERVVTPLDGFLDLSLEQLVSTLAAAFRQSHATQPGAITAQEWSAAEALAHSKYESAAWLNRIP